MWNMEDSKVQKRTWQGPAMSWLAHFLRKLQLSNELKVISNFMKLSHCTLWLSHSLSIFPLDKSPRMKWLVQQSFRITSIPASQDFTRQTEKLTQPRFWCTIISWQRSGQVKHGQAWSSHQAVQWNVSKYIKVSDETMIWNVSTHVFSPITMYHMGLGHSAEQPPQLQRQILAQATSYFLQFQFVASVASVASLPGKSSCCCQNPTERTSEEIDRNDIRHFATAIDWLEKCQKMQIVTNQRNPNMCYLSLSPWPLDLFTSYIKIVVLASNSTGLVTQGLDSNSNTSTFNARRLPGFLQDLLRWELNVKPVNQ